MGVEQLKQDIRQKNFRPVYLLWGDERYLLQQTVSDLETALAPGGEAALNLERLDGDAAQPEDVVMAATTTSFFYERKLVIVKNAPWFSIKRKAGAANGEESAGATGNADCLLSYLAQPEESTCLVFILPEGENAAKTLKTVKAVQKVGDLVQFQPLKDESLQMWLRQAFRDRGQKLTLEAGRELVARSGNDLTLLSAEIEKISSYAQGRSEITAADIQAVGSTNVQATLFQLVDAAVAGNAKRSKECLEDILLKEGPYGVIPILAGRFRFMLLILDMKKHGRGLSEIMRETKQRSEWYVEKTLRQAQTLGVERLKTALRILLQADVKTKRGLTEIEDALDLALLQICALIR